MAASRPGRSVTGRVLLIVLTSGAILAFAAYSGRALIGRYQTARGLSTGSPQLEPVAGARFVRSYPVVFNGRKTTFGHYVSPSGPDEVVKQIAATLKSHSESDRPAQQLPMLASLGPDRAVLSYVSAEGTAVGVVAFARSKGGGCEYLVGTSRATEPKRTAETDCPGREPPGVPRPTGATRTLCIENLGGVNAVMTCYDAWGSPGAIADDFGAAMKERGWTPRQESSRTLTGHFDGDALLSFSRGREQCVVAVDRQRTSGKIVVLIFWAERPWLPEGTAL